MAGGATKAAFWNSRPGVTPVTKFKDRKTAVSHVWQRIQRLGETAPVALAKPKAERKAKGEGIAKGAPVRARWP